MKYERIRHKTVVINGFVLLMMGAMVVWGCSSAPEPPAEPSKKEIRQDADGFFKKMEQEEAKPSRP